MPSNSLGKGRSRTKLHPREEASIISHLFFYWELPILWKGYRKEFTAKDLYGPLKVHEAKRLGDKLEKAWIEVQNSNVNPSFWRALLKVFGWELAWYGLLLIPMEFVCSVSQPLLMKKLLESSYSDDSNKSERYFYASAMVTAQLVKILVVHPYRFSFEHLGMKTRVACTLVIYRKCLKLKLETLAEVTVGKIINLIATDVGKFNCEFVAFVHYVWLAPLHIIVVGYVVYNCLGFSSIIGMSILLGYFPLQIFMARKISVFRKKLAQGTDRRVRLLNEIIEGIKVIKMFSWEKPFTTLTENFRKLEVRYVKYSLLPYCLSNFFSTALVRSTAFASTCVYITMGGFLNSSYIFTLMAFYEVFKFVTGIFLVKGATGTAEIITSLKRVEHFLNCSEISRSETISNHDNIVLNNVFVKRGESKENALSNVTLTVARKQIIGIIGVVGSGKSTLLQVMLNEILVQQGSVEIGGTISYACQETWLFNDTVKDNILFGESLDEPKYNEVVKVCALERDFSLLPFGDSTLVGDKGAQLSGGQKSRISLARAVYKEADFYLFDDPLSAVDAQVGRFIFKKCIKEFLSHKSIVLVTHQLQYLQEMNQIYVFENGKVVTVGTYEELKSMDYFRLLPTERKENKLREFEDEIIRKKTDNDLNFVFQETEQKTRAISINTYKNYLKAGGTVLAIATVVVLLCGVQFTANVMDYFLAVWVNLEEKNKGSAPSYFLYIYASLISILIVMCIVGAIIFVKFLANTSFCLHRTMLNKIMHAPMNFFNVHSTGQILNRFSSDIGQIDKNLSITAINAALITITIIGIVILITIVNYWNLPLALLMAVVFYHCRHAYLRTSRNLKRIEAQYWSPIYSLLTSTLQGLATIRALKGEKTQQTKFESYLDAHSSAYYLYLACDYAFGFWTDICCFIYNGLVILGLLLATSEQHSGNIGLVITQCYALLGMLQYGLKQYTELENQMVSVERIEEYCEIDTESASGLKLSQDWPTGGRIEFQAVSLRYRPDYPLVLKDLSFLVDTHEKIGIVGRTGAGKSSLISVLFRLFDFEGRILIDGTDTKMLPLPTLRSKISIIPQDPVLFSCSIRTNLDPFEEYQDSQLWEALNEVELKGVISELPSGLSSKLTEGGLNFSVGQRQLLSLARAIVKKNRILVMDEATANVDLKTDKLIQATIRKKFNECIVLTIAHRLHTVMDCDRVLVMDGGSAVEFDTPSALLENKDGTFYKLVHFGTDSTN